PRTSTGPEYIIVIKDVDCGVNKSLNLSQITQVLSKTIGNVNIKIPMLLCCIFVILNCYALLCTVYGLL
ncbi:MAG: hypothetical protein ACRD6U_03900, partial [Nitrososphaeraceae archaeon]